MKKRALAAFAAASAAALILLAAPSASAQVVTDTAGPGPGPGPGTVAAAVPSSRTTVVTHQALSPDTISGPHYWMYTNDANPGGRIDFWPNGDVFELCDIQADGHGVNAYYYWVAANGYYTGIDMDASGSGTCTVSRGSQGGLRDLPEEACIGVQIGINTLPQYDDVAYWLNDNDIKANCSP
jgi:hypothetical protein